jgi:hypothetical protein
MTERIELLDDLGAEFARVAAEAERKQSEHFASATASSFSWPVPHFPCRLHAAL